MNTSFKSAVDVEYVFRITRSSAPKEVVNLWSLWVTSKNEPDGIKLVDNDSLQMVLDKIPFVLELDGY